MNALQQIGAIALPLSLFLIVLGLGLRTSFSTATYLLRAPRLLGRSIFAMYVAIPVAVAVLVLSFELHPAVKVALLTLAVSPVPPLLPRKELKLVEPGREAYVYGLLVATCLSAIVVIPVAVAVFAALFGVDARVTPFEILRVVLLTVLLPLALGLAIRRLWPGLERLAAPAEALGVVLLLAAAVVILARVWPSMASLIGDGTLVAIVVVVALSLAVGHLLGGPIEDDRTALALATASRHPGVAIAASSAVHEALAPAAVLLAFVVGAAATVPYAAWRKRMRASATAAQTGTRLH